jgi:hypothetical protein
MALSEKLRAVKELTLALGEKKKRRHRNSPALWATEMGLLLDADGEPTKPDPWQVVMLDSPQSRICLNIHRQGGKSTMSSLICLHKALFKPGSLSLIVAPALRQSQENFRKIKDIIELLPGGYCPEFDESTKLSLRFANGSRILSLPGGNEGKTIRGFSRPDVIVEDEAAQCSDELHAAILPMMLTNPACKFILCSTPFGQRGHFYKIMTDGGHEWLKQTLKASDNPRISRAFLAEQRNSPLGPWYYQQEYECEFIAGETQLISHESILKAMDSGITTIEI